MAAAEQLNTCGGLADDDDAPPPLDSLSDQLYAARLADSIIGTAGLHEGELRTAAVTDSSGKEEPTCMTSTSSKPAAVKQQSANSKPFRKGFLDAKPRSNSSKQDSSSKQQRPTSGKQTHIPLIKPQQPQQLGSKAIPEMFMVPPDEQQQRLAAVKSQLLTALQPTPDTVSAVAEDSTLMSGFDDPEVMAAVAEVARDPKAFAKYAKNPKVQQFYMRMGNLVGSRLEKMGQSVS